MPIKFKGDLDFTRTRMFLEKLKGLVHSSFFDKYGKMGAEALAAGTPKKNTTTANAWYYKVTMRGNRACINWRLRRSFIGIWEWNKEWWMGGRTKVYRTIDSAGL